MNSPKRHDFPAGQFWLGLFFGGVAYWFYLRFLTEDELTATGLGWLCFAPQYGMSWICEKLSASDLTELVSCYAIVALFYGYIFLSLSVARRTALIAFITSMACFLALVRWQHQMGEGLGITLSILLWPGSMMRDLLIEVGVSKHWIRVLVESFTVGCWYAGLISGVRTFFILMERFKTSGPKSNATGPAATMNCFKCGQALKVPATTTPLQVRCPTCKSTFASP